MSVYVDRLPKSCYECVCNDDGWKCGINREDISHNGRRKDCPLKVIVRLESDLISRQAAIEALTGWQTDPTDEEIMRTLKALPPVEPPKKVVAQIKIDVEEIVERIKEEYEITEKPVCEDAIRCYEFLKERIGSETTDNAEEFEKWFERMVWHVQKCNEHDTEMRNVSEDAISKHDLWRIIEDNAYWITCNETSREKGMTLTGINQALNECPPVEPKRPKTTETMMVDGEPTEIDPLSYEIGYSHGQSERPKGECRTCERCSDHCCETDENLTRCPIEEHYSLPKDGYCHLYDPIWRGDKE